MHERERERDLYKICIYIYICILYALQYCFAWFGPTLVAALVDLLMHATTDDLKRYNTRIFGEGDEGKEVEGNRYDFLESAGFVCLYLRSCKHRVSADTLVSWRSRYCEVLYATVFIYIKYMSCYTESLHVHACCYVTCISWSNCSSS